MNEKLAGRLLVADDDADILATIRLILKPEGHRIDAAQSPAGVLTCLSTSGPYDAILLDLNYAKGNTNGQEGIDLIGAIRRIDAEVPIMVMTAWGSVGLAVSALRRGARDFIEKPFEPARLKSALASANELQRAVRRSHILESELAALTTPDKPVLIAESKSMAPVLNLIAKVGPSDANVLITGEPGTGKDVVARLVHSVSSRSAKPLVVVNAGGLADTLFESELFGHVKGAFTDARTDRVGRFELANGGTLFLDEIGNVPMALQTKLLRVLEVGEMERVGSSRTIKVDVRVISATNANLGQEVANNRFREDLLYRLNTVEIRLPPLRERREDIPVLAGHFLRTHAQRYRRSDRDGRSGALRRPHGDAPAGGSNAGASGGSADPKGISSCQRKRYSGCPHLGGQPQRTVPAPAVLWHLRGFSAAFCPSRSPGEFQFMCAAFFLPWRRHCRRW